MFHLKNSIRKFQGNERGAVAIMFAAALFVVFGGLAAAVDLTYTATVSSDVRHVGKSICGRAASAMNRGMSEEKMVDLSTKLGTELIQKTSLYNKNAAFNVNFDGSTGKVSVAGRATVSTPFISLFGVKSMRPNDTIECSGPVPTPPAPAPPPPTSQNSNCGGGAAAASATLGPQWTAINNGPGSSTTGFSNQSSGSQNGNSSGQGNSYVNHNAGVNSNNSNGSSANSSGGYSGQNGSTQGSATTSALGANSLSCSNASTANSSGSSFSFASGSGPGATANTSTNASASSNGGGSSGGGAGGGPNGGGGGGGGSFCVGAGC